MKRKQLEGAFLLIVDDEHEHLLSLQKIFEREGAQVSTATSAERALDHLRESPVQIILTDLMMPGMNGQELLRAARAIRPEVDVVVMTAYATIENAVEAMRQGAYDFIQKPFKSALVIRVIERAVERQTLRTENKLLKRELADLAKDSSPPIIGGSPAMLDTMEIVHQAAPSTASVLLYGESGTGKELLAHAIHDHSPRKDKPFVVVNCAALPEGVLEAELFGFEKGAFTGALEKKEGRIERAHEGTLFLDEVGEMTPSTQAKLLRILQEGEFERVGGTTVHKVDFRLVSATNRELEQSIKEGLFREDLYYRLNVIGIHLPALRDRPEDIPLIADHFVRHYARKNDKTVNLITEEARVALLHYAWPGNVRELENVIERAVVLTKGPTVGLQDLPGPVRSGTQPGQRALHREGGQVVIPFGTKLDEIERFMILETLKETRGDKSLAAQLLGIAARTIYRKLEAERNRDAD